MVAPACGCAKQDDRTPEVPQTSFGRPVQGHQATQTRPYRSDHHGNHWNEPNDLGASAKGICSDDRGDDKYRSSLGVEGTIMGDTLVRHGYAVTMSSRNCRFDSLLKYRGIGDTWPAPARPELVGILRRHIAPYGLGPDGRLFAARTDTAGARLIQPHNNPASMSTV